MDDQTHNEPKPEEHKPVATPVMDIKPPIGAEKLHSMPADPVMSHSPESKSEKRHDPEIATQPTKSTEKHTSNGTGGAIFATVVIVIVLAALATYAYLKTAK